jgi:hypothetical protein
VCKLVRDEVCAWGVCVSALWWFQWATAAVVMAKGRPWDPWSGVLGVLEMARHQTTGIHGVYGTLETPGLLLPVSGSFVLSPNPEMQEWT